MSSLNLIAGAIDVIMRPYQGLRTVSGYHDEKCFRFQLQDASV
jgi:hypothetical protein